jgi:hypothetical protein
MDVEKGTHTPAMFVPIKTAPRVEGILSDMMLRSERGREGGGSSANLVRIKLQEGTRTYMRDLGASLRTGGKSNKKSGTVASVNNGSG